MMKHIIVILLILPITVVTKIVSGVFENKYSWKFIARFCYQSGQSTDVHSDERKLKYDISFHEDLCCPTLNLYYDSPEQWASVYGSRLSCDDRQRKARERITFSKNSANCKKIGKIYHCHGMRYVTGVRSRWWYMAVSNCNRNTGLFFNYTFTFTNGDHFIDRHFSADELGILESNLVSLSLMILIFTVTVFYNRMLNKRKLNHETFKLFVTSVFFYLLNCLLLSVYYGLYAKYGNASRNILLTARVLEIIATSSFLCLLLAFSTGFTIVSSAMSLCSFSVVSSFTGTFFLLMVSSLIWEVNIFDPAAVLYMYMSPPGYLLGVIFIPAWIYFIANGIFTCYKFSRKRQFYFALCLFYSVWLLCLPFLMLVANTVLPDWVRFKTVIISQQFVWLFSYMYMLVIFMPSHSNKHFPFHLRATKVDFDDEPIEQDNNYSVKVPKLEKKQQDQIEMAPVNNDTDRNYMEGVLDLFTVT